MIGAQQSVVKHFRWGVFFLICFALAVYAGEANAQVLDQISDGYRKASAGWFGVLSEMAKSLFWKLALIEFAWSTIIWALTQEQMSSFTSVVVRKIMGIGFFYYILLNADYWIPAIINGLIKAGTSAGKTTAISPSNVFDTGIDTAVSMLTGIKDLSLWTDFATVVIAGLAALVIVIAFLVVAGQLLVAQIESYIAISAGVLFLGFGGSRWTTDFAQKYISYAFATGVKLFMLYLIIGVGTSQADSWAAMVRTTSWDNIFSVMGGALMLAFLAFQIPAMAAAMLSGAPTLTGGALASTAGTLAAGGVAAGATVMSPAMQSARGGMQALKAGYEHSRAQGSGTIASALKAIGTSTSDYAKEATRSVANVAGLAQPISSAPSIGGRAAETRQGMTAALKETQASAPAGGSTPPASTAASAPASPGSGGATGAAGADGAPGSASVGTSSGGTSSGGTSSGGASSGGASPGATLGGGGSGAGGGGTSAGGSSGGGSAAASGATASGSSGTSSATSAPPLPAQQSGDKPKDTFKPLSDLPQVRPPQIPNDAAPPAGVNINLGHNDE